MCIYPYKAIGIMKNHRNMTLPKNTVNLQYLAPKKWRSEFSEKEFKIIDLMMLRELQVTKIL